MDAKKAATENQYVVNLSKTHTPGMIRYSTQSLSSTTKNGQLLKIELSSRTHSLPHLSNKDTHPYTQHRLKQQCAIPSVSISKCKRISQLQANEFRNNINWHSLVLKWKLPEENKWLVPENEMDKKQVATQSTQWVNLNNTREAENICWSTYSLS